MRSKTSGDAVRIIQADGSVLCRFPDGSEYIVRRMIQDNFIPNAEAATYAERIAPQLMPLDDALTERGISRSEWLMQREAAAMSELYGCEVETTLH